MKNWVNNEEFLLDIAVPSATNSYSPIPHQIFIDELQEHLYKKGISIVDKKYLTDKKGLVLTGEYGLKSINTEDSEAVMSIGFQNSYNKTKTAGLYSGALVLVCKNGMYTRQQGATYNRKHTGTALEDLRKNISISVEHSQNNFLSLMHERESMKQRELNKRTIANLVGDMYLNEGIISNTQLSIIKHEMNFSQDFKEKTAWGLYNWCTESLKECAPGNYIKSHLKLHTYISNKLALSDTRLNLYGTLENEKLLVV